MKLLVRLSLCFGMACLWAAPMSADTFNVYNISSANNRNLIGIDSAGDILLLNNSVNRYELYFQGLLVSSSTSMPSFTRDNGGACAEPPGAGSSGHGVCNGAREVYTVTGDPVSSYYEIYPGSPSLGDFIYTGQNFDTPISGGFAVSAALNNRGDFVYVDGHNENIIEFSAVATTPEPSSLMLVTTGLGGLVTLIRRRYSVSTPAAA